MRCKLTAMFSQSLISPKQNFAVMSELNLNIKMKILLVVIPLACSYTLLLGQISETSYADSSIF